MAWLCAHSAFGLWWWCEVRCKNVAPCHTWYRRYSLSSIAEDRMRMALQNPWLRQMLPPHPMPDTADMQDQALQKTRSDLVRVVCLILSVPQSASASRRRKSWATVWRPSGHAGRLTRLAHHQRRKRAASEAHGLRQRGVRQLPQRQRGRTASQSVAVGRADR